MNPFWRVSLIAFLIPLFSPLAQAQDCSLFTRRLFFGKPKPQEEIWKVERLEGFNSPKALQMKADLEKTLKTGRLDLDRRMSDSLAGAWLAEADNTRVIMKESLPKKGMIAGNEVAAYRLDQLLGGKNRVPLTVRRNVAGGDFSLQTFVSDTEPYWKKSKDLDENEMIFFDYLIDNTDRRTANVLLHEQNIVAIDHGLSFRTAYAEKQFRVPKEYSWSVQFLQRCKQMKQFLRMTDECVLELIRKIKPSAESHRILKETSEEKFKALFQGEISEYDIQAFLKRRRILLDYLDGGPFKID